MREHAAGSPPGRRPALRRRSRRRPLALLVAALGAFPLAGAGAEPPSGLQVATAADQDEGPVRPGDAWRALVELKREATNRGSPDETTRTNLRLEGFLAKGPVAFVRLDLPFPDERTGFSGSVLEPRLGDVRTRLGFRPFTVGGLSLLSFLEATFPTADPGSLGSGKVQLQAGLRHVAPLFRGWAAPRGLDLTGAIQVSQVISVAGDESRKDVDNTRLELSVTYAWGRRPSLKLIVEPTIDWVQGGKTGAVLELEGRWQATRGFAIWLRPGIRLWGERVPGTYDERIALGLVARA